MWACREPIASTTVAQLRHPPIAGSTKGAGTHLVSNVVRAHVLIGPPETKLLGPAHALQPTAAQREKTGCAGSDHAHGAQVREPTQLRGRTLRDDATCACRADSRHAQELLARGGPHSIGKCSGCASAQAVFGSVASGRFPSAS